jgi:ATP-binding cassette subfamily C protein
MEHSRVGASEPLDGRGYRWRDLLVMVGERRRELVLANLVAVLAVLVAVPVPLLMPVLVDEVLLQEPGAAVTLMQRSFPDAWHGPLLYVGVILVISVLLRLLAVALGVLQSRQFTIISKDVIYHIRRDLLRRLERVSMAEYEALGSGTVASYLVTDLDAVDTFVGGAVAKLLVAVLSIAGTAAVLLWMHWQLGLFILLLNPLVIYLTVILGRRVKEMKRRENKAYEVFQQGLHETLEAIQQIRAGNRERFYIGRTIDSADAIRRWSSAFTWKNEAAGRFSFVVFAIGFDLFRAVSMLMVVFSDLTIGEMLAVFAYLWFMIGPVQDVLGVQYAFHAADAALRRINRLRSLQLEPRWPHRRNPFAGREQVGVTLDKVSFAYGNGPAVLDRVSLSIGAGEKVALVGSSGAGKTTLIQIVLGLYAPSSGRVLFDGVPIEQIGMDVVRDHVATVLQHPALFNDSVRMNLTLGRAITDARLWEALEIAQLGDVVRRLEQGLETIVGRSGIRLSGGQRQRLAVARMVLANPKVVILDEATSALDSETEARLYGALQRFLANRTTLIIAHRLSAVRGADRVLVLEQGRIVEQGRHEELIDAGGRYARLFARQAGSL